MADGFRLDIDGDLARLIDRRASETGGSRETIVREALAQSLFPQDGYSWVGDDPRTVARRKESDGPGAAWSDVEARLRVKLDGLLAKA